MIVVVKELNLQCLIKSISRLSSGNCTMSSVLFAVDFFDLLLFLDFLSSGLYCCNSIHAPSHTHSRVITRSLVCSHILFVYQVVSSRYCVVSVRFDTLCRIICLETVLVLHQFENGLIVGHLFFSWEQTTQPFFFGNFEPWM
jgi:hypothetical protein